MGWEVGERFKREGTSVYLWLIHFDVWQKPTQYYKAIILQLKINNFFKKDLYLVLPKRNRNYSSHVLAHKYHLFSLQQTTPLDVPVQVQGNKFSHELGISSVHGNT